MDDRIRISEEVAVGGQPSEADIDTLEQEGFASVFNLRTEGEEDQPISPGEEGQLVATSGMEYRHIPVSRDELDGALVDRFCRELEAAPKPAFVHCGSGKRAGAFAMMDWAVEHGLSGEEALERARDKGFEYDEEELNRFVAGYVEQRLREPVGSG